MQDKKKVISYLHHQVQSTEKVKKNILKKLMKHQDQYHFMQLQKKVMRLWHMLTQKIIIFLL